MLISFHAFSNPVRFQTEGGSPQPGLTLGGQEAGNQHFFPGGGDWIWGEGGMNPLPQSTLHREKSQSPTTSVTETLQELSHCSSKSAMANLGIPKEPRTSAHDGLLHEGSQRGSLGRRPLRDTENQNTFPDLESTAHKPKSAQFLAQNDLQVILAGVTSKSYFKTIILV